METKKIKWGILGTGRIATVFATALQVVEDSELYAVGSRNMTKAQQFAGEYAVPKAYGSYEELVQDPDIDVIYIATPHNLHVENTLMALNHNKHVLCEKPLGVNRKEVKLLAEKASEKKLFLMEALWSRFLPNIIKVKELVESGVIGDVKLLTAFFSFKSDKGPEHRQFNIELCGGTILDIGIYNMFLSYLLLGKPKEISALAGLSEQGIDTSSSYTFKYNDDTIAAMYSSFLADSPTIAKIHGSKGRIELQHQWFCPGSVKLILNDGTQEQFDFNFKSNGYEFEAEEVVRCLQEGKTQSEMWSLNDSLQLVEIMDSVRKECGVVYPKHDF
ncbi:MAG: Gfo/Idh/MocA family oxidoreductase [Paludibacter sp.]|nr:Gfo/Idh/MocA family oxidoreductase [Paludibacter sp.]